jgi:signal transduction histidine kinase
MLCGRLKNPKSLLCFILLVVAAVAGNYFAISLFFGFDFLFGGIAVLLILYLYGTAAGLAVAALASSYTYLVWGHPYGIVIFTSEALFVGLLLRRLQGNFLLIDAAFWIMIGLPLVWFLYSSLLQWDNAATQLVILKQSLNGIYNALVASYLLYFTPLRRWARLREDERTHPFGQILASVLASFLLLPALAFLVVYGRLELNHIQRDVKRFLLENTSDVARDLVAWRDVYLRAVEQTARAGANSGMARARALQHDVEVIQRAFPDFHGLYVANAGGTTVAFSPAVNEKGESTIGINFSDREYFAELLNTRRPVLSAVFTGRGGVFAPIVALGFPVVEDGRFSGFAVGAINLGEVTRLLNRNTAGQDVQVTLIDQTGRVVTSTDANWKPLQPFIRRGGRDLQSLGDSVYQSFPRIKDLPDIIRWKQSYFTMETRVAGDLPWTLVATISARPYIDSLQQSYIHVLTVTLGFILMGLVLSQVLSRLMTRPLSGLASLTNQLPERIRAKLQNGWPRSRVKEISFLVDNFKTMECALRENFEALTLSKDALVQQARELNHLNENLREEIAERKLAEAKLRQNMDELEKANRVKNEFLAVMSHELRTPLNVIMGYNQMVQEGAFGGVNAEQSRALDKIKLQSAELLRMVNSILVVTKIETDDLSVELDAIDLESFIDGLKEEYNAPVNYGVTIVWHCQSDLPPLLSDADKLKHIMENLINNALKFTDKGYVRVSVKRLPGEERVALVVTDTGIGIAEKDLPVIFDKFRQADSSANRNYGGAGLGLYIVKKYTELLGGEVRVESAPGKGSTFTIALPLRHIEQETDGRDNSVIGKLSDYRLDTKAGARSSLPRMLSPA